MEAINVRKVAPSFLLGALIGFVFYVVARSLGFDLGASSALIGAIVGAVGVALNQKQQS